MKNEPNVPSKQDFEMVDRYCELRRQTRGLSNQEAIIEKLIQSGALTGDKKVKRQMTDMTWADAITMMILIAVALFVAILLR